MKVSSIYRHCVKKTTSVDKKNQDDHPPQSRVGSTNGANNTAYHTNADVPTSDTETPALTRKFSSTSPTPLLSRAYPFWAPPSTPTATTKL